MDNQQHMYEILKKFDTAMMITGSKGRMHARPMAVAELQPDGEAYFITTIGSPKVDEINDSPEAMLTFQSANLYAVIEGTVAVVHDTSMLDRLWKESWKVWFPNGKGDPSIRLLRFSAREGEYWDNAGIQGIKYVFKALSAYASGERPKPDRDQHAKVRL